MRQSWTFDMTDSFDRFLGKIATFLPNLLVMMTILIVGFLIAWVAKKLLFHFLRAIQCDRLCERLGLSHVLSKGGVGYSPSLLLSHLCYWIIVLITLILGINALEVAATQALVAKFFDYLPHLFTAILVLIVGYLIAGFLGQATLIAAVNMRLDSARLFSRAVRWFIIVLALTTALYQLGIAESVVLIAFAIILGGIVLALAIAFGWGGRDLAKEFLERLYRRKGPDEEGPEQDRISHV